MDTKVSNQSVPVEQVSNAEDVHNVTAQVQPEEVVATVNAEEPEVAESVDFSDEEARLAADNAGIDLGEATPEEEAQPESQMATDEQSLVGKSKAELIELFAQLLETKPVQNLRGDAEAIKIAFYKLRRVEVSDPLGRRIFAEYGVLDGGKTAVMEKRKNPLRPLFKRHCGANKKLVLLIMMHG